MIDHSIFSIDMENVGLKVHRADLEVILSVIRVIGTDRV